MVFSDKGLSLRAFFRVRAVQPKSHWRIDQSKGSLTNLVEESRDLDVDQRIAHDLPRKD